MTGPTEPGVAHNNEDQHRPGPAASAPAGRGVPPSPQAVNHHSAAYLEEQLERFRQDPSQLPADVRAFFQGFDLALQRSGEGLGAPAGDSGTPRGRTSGVDRAVSDLIYAYRQLGHVVATIDPFGRVDPMGKREGAEALEPSHHGLSDADLDRPVEPSSEGLARGGTLREVIEHLKRTYCGTIGFEYIHLQNTTEREWLQRRIEQHEGHSGVDRALKVHILNQLVKAESFEKFLGKRYPGEKRFSLEGGEALIPLLDRLIERGSELGLEEMVFGMAHRGRLSVLNNVLQKTYEQIFTEFEDSWEEDFLGGGGDVKYHKGYSGERRLRNGRVVRLAMSSNPSHLEAVNPVVLGRTRAKQYLNGDVERTRVGAVLIHGDAAVAGQGVVAECLNLSGTEGYTTGGTVHVVVNNQIGFTTLPRDGRSTRYCTDVAKFVDAPIFHVNGDDPEACVAAAELAIEYRQAFHKDVFIDLMGFRRYGHNEQDEPAYTQPIMAEMIKSKPGVLSVYAQRLLAEGVITERDAALIGEEILDALDKAQRSAKDQPYDPTIDPGSRRWAGMRRQWDFERCDTAVEARTIEQVCAAMGRVPEGFSAHRKLLPLLAERAALPTSRQISYADGESLAYGTLLLEGVTVRLSGQDCRRGTFSHRHAVLRDTRTEEAYIPLNHITQVGRPGSDTPPGSAMPDGRRRQAELCVWDSPLSEFSVLGFEYGASLVDPSQLVVWEAQFGDFCNGAQVVIDQFISSAEMKWDRWSGLVLLLPHGYEGQGPEHSSARLERFLQLCGQKNMQVAYPTTGAQVFHLLRRQICRGFRKPLIVMQPKSLLRTPTSTIDELSRGTFMEMLDDPRFASVAPAGNGKAARRADATHDPRRVRRVLLCSGKIFFELAARRDALQREDVAIVRLEQLYPLHVDLLRQTLDRYRDAEVYWVQEEPRNQGAFMHVADSLQHRAGITLTGYIGRDGSASPATGSKKLHKIEQEAILSKAVGPIEGDAAHTAPVAPASKVQPARA